MDSDDDSFLAAYAATQDDFEIKPGPSTEKNDYSTRLHIDENKPSKQPVKLGGSIPVGNKKSSEDFFDDEDDDIDGT